MLGRQGGHGSQEMGHYAPPPSFETRATSVAVKSLIASPPGLDGVCPTGAPEAVERPRGRERGRAPGDSRGGRYSSAPIAFTRRHTEQVTAFVQEQSPCGCQPMLLRQPVHTPSAGD